MYRLLNKHRNPIGSLTVPSDSDDDVRKLLADVKVKPQGGKISRIGKYTIVVKIDALTTGIYYLQKVKMK